LNRAISAAGNAVAPDAAISAPARMNAFMVVPFRDEEAAPRGAASG
jgi:hypothetical protein